MSYNKIELNDIGSPTTYFFLCKQIQGYVSEYGAYLVASQK